MLNDHRRTVVVVPLASASSEALPIRVAVRCQDRAAVAITDQIRVIARERLRTKIGMAASTELETIGLALKQIFELV